VKSVFIYVRDVSNTIAYYKVVCFIIPRNFSCIYIYIYIREKLLKF
jgi:hypothetical protein